MLTAEQVINEAHVGFQGLIQVGSAEHIHWMYQRFSTSKGKLVVVNDSHIVHNRLNENRNIIKIESQITRIPYPYAERRVKVLTKVSNAFHGGASRRGRKALYFTPQQRP